MDYQMELIRVMEDRGALRVEHETTKNKLRECLKESIALRKEVEALKDRARKTVEGKPGYYKRYGKKKSNVKLKVIQGGAKQ